MNKYRRLLKPLKQANFGGCIGPEFCVNAEDLIRTAELNRGMLPEVLAICSGLLLIQGLGDIAEQPELLVRISRCLGAGVENYRQSGVPKSMVHDTVPEILVVSNKPPGAIKPPPLPTPPLTSDGQLPTQVPQRRGWHTDQSFANRPPDVSLFFALAPTCKGQGQTIFADTTAAYETLPATLKAQVDALEGVHAKRSSANPQTDDKGGITHVLRSRHPVVRRHPVTGRRALYLCEFSQMDLEIGPFVGMEPGYEGKGAELLTILLRHMTSPQFTYIHEWEVGDLMIWDNRCLIHTATWFDTKKQTRVMWRTTVSGDAAAG
jgi:taurine dioxygenase